MSSMMEPAAMDQSSHNGVAQFTQSAPKMRIKRIGARPIVFEGSELAMAISYTPSLPYWYEVNLYRSSDQRFIAAVRLFHQSEDKQDTVRAWECDTLDTAIDKLVHYDAAHDVRLSEFETDLSSASAELAAAALHLHAQIKDQREHYGSLIGEFLYDLEKGA